MLEYQKWVEEKKKNFNHYKKDNELETIMSAGIENIELL